MQPDVAKTQAVKQETLDVIFTPGLAFDRDRNRLGRGAGFYDRFIKTLKRHTRTIGVAFDFQITKNLPVAIPHDQALDGIVAETMYI
jgi:5-formyltetrahydrofolate cyclo-ligase